jgi:anti-sigma factor RsiW
MNCRKVQNLISAYVDSELPGVEMLAVRQHIGQCAECNTEYESLLKMKRAFGGMNPKMPSPGLADRIYFQLDQVSEAPKEPFGAAIRKRMTFFPGKLRLAAAAIGTIAIMLTVRSGQLAPGLALLPIPQSIQMADISTGDPGSLFPAAAHVRGAHLVTLPSPAPSASWEVSRMTASANRASGGGTMLASYSMP